MPVYFGYDPLEKSIGVGYTKYFDKGASSAASSNALAASIAGAIIGTAMTAKSFSDDYKAIEEGLKNYKRGEENKLDQILENSRILAEINKRDEAIRQEAEAERKQNYEALKEKHAADLAAQERTHLFRYEADLGEDESKYEIPSFPWGLYGYESGRIPNWDPSGESMLHATSTGASIGTLIAPGVGSGVGAVLGAIAGGIGELFNAFKSDKAKRKAKKKQAKIREAVAKKQEDDFGLYSKNVDRILDINRGIENRNAQRQQNRFQNQISAESQKKLSEQIGRFLAQNQFNEEPEPQKQFVSDEYNKYLTSSDNSAGYPGISGLKLNEEDDEERAYRKTMQQERKKLNRNFEEDNGNYYPIY